MKVSVSVRDLTQAELFSLEYTLRQILDRDKSSDSLKLAFALGAEIRRRARDTLREDKPT